MIWIRTYSMTYLFLAMLAMLAGCASGPRQPGEVAESVAHQQAEEALLEERFQQAVALMESGEADAAESRFVQLVKDYPGHTGPLVNLGILAFQNGDFENATAYFKSALDLDSGHPVALNQLGVIARMQGNFDAAEQNYREALRVEPDYLPAMLNLAFLLDIYLGRPAEALALYERYQSLAEEPDPRIEDWIFDTRNRL
ncbi:tetratricopeptide repeat protein [Marinobacter nitratireducens]|nr:tetratricopeptide repeat protein [Marinobacter nitratireducens]